jgi:hypothetical protein
MKSSTHGIGFDLEEFEFGRIVDEHLVGAVGEQFLRRAAR